MKVITVGRSPENDIVINDLMVSRIHLQIVQNNDGICSVVDLNSANGTYVNGIKISGERRLQLNDLIRIGNTNLPWQKYLGLSDITEQCQVRLNTRSIKPTRSKQSKRFLLYGTLCLLVIIVCGIGIYFCCNNKTIQSSGNTDAKNNENTIHNIQIEDEQSKTNQSQAADPYSLVRKMTEKAATSKEEAQEAKTRANEAYSLANKEKTRANEAYSLANEADSLANEANKRANEANKRAYTADSLAQAKIDSINSLMTTTVSQNNETIAKLQQKKEGDSLLIRFYEEYDKLEKKSAEQACQKLSLQTKRGDNAKAILKKKFIEANNNNEKRQILNKLIIANNPQNNKQSEEDKNVSNDVPAEDETGLNTDSNEVKDDK